MFFNTAVFLLASPLAAFAVSVPGLAKKSTYSTASELAKKSNSNKQLADGNTSPDPFGYLDGGLEWTSSGVLDEGCPSSIKIDDCYTLQLAGDVSEDLNNGKDRQRIEFYEGKVRDDKTRTYKWKYYLDSKTGTNKNFFHLTTLFSDGVNSPIITLSAQKDKVFIKDILQQGFCSSSGCPSVDLADYTDRITQHTMDITYGPTGTMKYTVVDADSGNTLIDFSASGYMGSSQSTVKYGMYRRTHDGLTDALAYWGDWSQVNVTST